MHSISRSVDLPGCSLAPWALRSAIAALVLIALLRPSFAQAQAAADPAQAPPAPELEPALAWINTDTPLRFDDQLKGHVVLLDFWTYCCINCIHVIPDLEYLEAKYEGQPFLVIGVHSAKFIDEGKPENVCEAVERYDVRHPVVVDDEMKIWRNYRVRAWPTFVLVGSDGRIIGTQSGEGNRALLDSAIRFALDEGRARGDLADTPLEYLIPLPEDDDTLDTELAFPGKVLAIAPDENHPNGALFIADSSNDRVIHAQLPDDDGNAPVIRIFGTGERGLTDGPHHDAQFNDPQGFAYHAQTNTLYVADMKNHAIRAIDLTSNRVTTAVGTGEQSYDRRGGRLGTEQGLASPWDLELAHGNNTLYVAMAGTHQLWKVNLKNLQASVFSGTGRESIIDGPALRATLAQPSGLALSPDANHLYFADSETSAIRRVDLTDQRNFTETLIGTGLFDFGDRDGAFNKARLQHPLDVAFISNETHEQLFIVDTYNNKVKVIDVDNRTIHTFAVRAGNLDFDEPAGLAALGSHLYLADTNNHRIVRIDAENNVAKPITLSFPEQPVN